MIFASLIMLPASTSAPSSFAACSPVQAIRSNTARAGTGSFRSMIESADTTHASAAASMSVSFRDSPRLTLRRSMSAKKGASKYPNRGDTDISPIGRKLYNRPFAMPSLFSPTATDTTGSPFHLSHRLSCGAAGMLCVTASKTRSRSTTRRTTKNLRPSPISTSHSEHPAALGTSPIAICVRRRNFR